jgi:hypothetical protein
MIRGDFLLPCAPPLPEVMVNHRNRPTHHRLPTSLIGARGISVSPTTRSNWAKLACKPLRQVLDQSPPKTLNLVSQKHGAEMAI